MIPRTTRWTEAFRRGLLGVAALVCTSCTDADAPDLVVAVAANFAGPMGELVERFEASTGYETTMATGSTGKLYAQILNGAPYDLFFGADRDRPARLAAERGLEDDRLDVYAVGGLVLWSAREDVVDPAGAVLSEGEFRHLAVAHPELAPYGAAAVETLERLGLRTDLEDRIVRGETIAQAYGFVEGGHAELGFVARSQVDAPGRDAGGSRWDVPDSLHAPIEQAAVRLADTDAARAFWDFVRTDASRTLIRSFGYGTP